MLISLFIVFVGVLIILSFLSVIASTVMDWVSNIFHLKGRNLERALKNMMSSSDVNETVFNQFKENPVYRQLSKYPNREGSKPSYMNKETFQSILLNTISNGRDLNDPEKVKEYIELLPDVDLKNTLRQLMADAGGDMNQFRTNVGLWYDDVMERSRGWYSRMTKRGLLTIGVVIALLFNVDAIHVFKSLQSNPEQLQRVVSAAQYLQTGADGSLGVTSGVSNLLTPTPSNQGFGGVQPYNPAYNQPSSNPAGGAVQPFSPPSTQGAQPQAVQPFTPPGQGGGVQQPATQGMEPFVPPGQEAMGAQPQPYDPAAGLQPGTPPATMQWRNLLLQDKDLAALVDSNSVRQVQNAFKRNVESATSPLGIGWDLDQARVMTTRDWIVKVIGWLITGFSISFGAPVLFDVLKKLKEAKVA